MIVTDCTLADNVLLVYCKNPISSSFSCDFILWIVIFGYKIIDFCLNYYYYYKLLLDIC